MPRKDRELYNKYMREYYRKNKDKLLPQIMERRKDNPEYQQHQQEWIRTHATYHRDYHRKNIITTGGKMVKVNKRPRPEDDICEICGGKVVRLEYHHWDNEHPCLGLWLCCGCHRMAERIDKDLHIKYLQEKEEMVLMPPSV